MSSLSTDCKVCYVPVLYSQWDGKVYEGSEYETEDGAVEAAKELIETHIDDYNMYCYAEIKRCVVPLYK